MRFYNLTVTNPATGKVAFSAGSYPGGIYDPGALNVIFDVLTYDFAQPHGGSTITIEGVDPTILSNAQNFAIPKKNYLIELSGGMGAGLPLANPRQAGLLFAGEIYQSFGNWLGTEINLNLVFSASALRGKQPNIALNWTAGTQLSVALTNALTVAYPNAKVKVNIGNYVLPHDEVGTHESITGFAQMIDDITSGAVQMTASGNTIYVYDKTYSPPPVQLQFTDFVGQPVWVAANRIQIMCIMRSDIRVGRQILMPAPPAGGTTINQPGFVQTTAASYPSQSNYTLNIKGKFVVKAVRHIGNLRQPDGRSWCTVINAAPAV